MSLGIYTAYKDFVWRQKLKRQMNWILLRKEKTRAVDSLEEADALARKFRSAIRNRAGVTSSYGNEKLDELLAEYAFLRNNYETLRPFFMEIKAKRVLYAGQAYYNAWYLSRELRKLHWRADVLNWDLNEQSQLFYHGEDVHFTNDSQPYDVLRDFRFYLGALYRYDVFHFSNANGMCFGFALQNLISQHYEKHDEITLLKKLGKAIVYSNSGCMDGVSQTSFSKWGDTSVCSICPWQHRPEICSDTANLAWGKFRNEMADYQCLLGGNRTDYNTAPTVHESPEFYCLDKQLWHPDLEIPEAFRLPDVPEGTVWVYHAVGNKKLRTSDDGVNIKSSHIYVPLIEKLKAEGIKIEMYEPVDVPNREVRFMQAQMDIFCEMLTFGWFGANAREAMMLGKPVICYIRPEWLESLRREIPEYAEELPIISANPDTVEAVLRDLIAHPEKRREIGRKSRIFAEKWHASDNAAKRFDEIYTKLLQGDKQLNHDYA